MAELPTPINEPVRSYAPGSPERAALKARLVELSATRTEIPNLIGGEECFGEGPDPITAPHQHSLVLGSAANASAGDIDRAIEAAREAGPAWRRMSWEARSAIFLRAAALLAGPWRDTVNAATMLGQSKTAHQAEIDAACELIDFWRFNLHFAEQIFAGQPISDSQAWNRMEYRPLEGFVYAITPFNFTSIAGNLPTAPALLGNTVVWKPASRQMLSAHFLMRLLIEAGLPPGVINLVHGDAPSITRRMVGHRDLAGVHFTGSTAVFRSIWRQVADNLDNYRSFPRLVGETGGKDFVVAHASADPDQLRTALLRGAFEYQGQKCSAASRAYVPHSIWKELRPRLVDEAEGLAMGDPADFRNFLGAVIDERAFARHREALAFARGSQEATLLAGGECDDEVGYFVRPTVIETSDPHFRLMEEELFGPILTVYPYPDGEFERVLELCDQTSPYALTGAVFARDREAIELASAALADAAGNFYVNDKPTGAVVGQQPFGGARASGTNDKAGSPLNLLRWLSPRVIKETLVPPADHRYPFMSSE